MRAWLKLEGDVPAAIDDAACGKDRIAAAISPKVIFLKLSRRHKFNKKNNPCIDSRRIALVRSKQESTASDVWMHGVRARVLGHSAAVPTFVGT